ncbi:MAG: peptide-methionine (S)-S-oxide reductase MsrA [Spirochaetota bacterium]
MEQNPQLVHHVTKENGTEAPFDNAYWNNHLAGLYVDPYNGQVLFSSTHKYNSHSGWPSFYQAIHSGNIEQRADRSLGMERVEVRSRSSDSHLGHVFNDGPLPSGRRYCINSAALRFIPLENLEAAGYTDYLPLFAANPQGNDSPLFKAAIFAGGCFWCTEAAFKGLEGVMNVYSGYTGGRTTNPSYSEVCSGTTKHYEAVLILYEPEILPYRTLLDIFWHQIDPTDQGGQFHDRGSQYRSAIFYRTAEEKHRAEQSKAELQAKQIFGDKEIVTPILPESPFYLAEEYHQDYFVKEPRT